MKKIKVRQDKKTGDCYLALKDFKDVIDIKKVAKYTFETTEDAGTGAMCGLLTFYDEDNNVVNTKNN